MRGQNKQNHAADAGGPNPRSAWKVAALVRPLQPLSPPLPPPPLDVPLRPSPGAPSKMSERLNCSANNQNIPFSLNRTVTLTKNIQPLMGQRWSWIHAFKGWEKRDRIFLCSTV